MSRKRCLITGSCGFFGAHLVDYLLRETDWDIVGIDSFAHRGEALRINDSEEKISRYRVICHDLNAPFSDFLVSEIGNVDFIVNVASHSDVARSIGTPETCVLNNVNLMLNMLGFALRQPSLQRFIQLSTDEVYGESYDGKAIDEWAPILPSNPYAASKAAQEAIAISYWRTFGLPLQILNSMNLFGERQDTEKFIPMVIGRVMRGETVTIHGDDSGAGSRGYLYTENLAAAIHFLILNPCTQYKPSDHRIFPDRFNVTGKDVTNLDVAQEIARVIGKPLDYEFVPFEEARSGHDRQYSLNPHRLQAAGFNHPISFEKGIKQTIEWSVKNKKWVKA